MNRVLNWQSCSHLHSAGALYAHTAAKIVFMRLFRGTHHIHSHTVLGWVVWAVLCFVAVAVAFVLAAAVPIFSDLTGIAASLFAAWFTYGIAGFFWIHDTYYLKGGMAELKRRRIGTTLALLTILAGAFICIAGTYVSIKARPHPHWISMFSMLTRTTVNRSGISDGRCGQAFYLLEISITWYLL